MSEEKRDPEFVGTHVADTTALIVGGFEAYAKMMAARGTPIDDTARDAFIAGALWLAVMMQESDVEHWMLIHPSIVRELNTWSVKTQIGFTYKPVIVPPHSARSQ